VSERLRLETLCSRRGIETTREWAKATAVAYRLCISAPTHYAFQPNWRPLFEKSIRELKMFADSEAVFYQGVKLRNERTS
jgi:hypothetical protein